MTGEDGTILMLQGPPCRFWRELGAGFRRSGRGVRHIGFSLADRLWWRSPGGSVFDAPIDSWPRHLADEIRRHSVSDIIYYADRLPYHRVAIDVARKAGVRAWTLENGYLRPDWLTLEPEAMGAYSRLGRDPSSVLAEASGRPAPDPTVRYGHGFAREAMSEVAYNLTMSVGRPRFRHYVPDKHYAPVLDYLGWLGKWAFGGAARKAAQEAEDLARAGRPFYLLALQLESDYQIRASSGYASLGDMLEEVIASFAVEAPPDVSLVVKQHPMDNGLEAWPWKIRRLARESGVGSRVIAADGGALDLFLEKARGVITVNSTVGLQALRQDCPVIALGDAVYDMQGLTHRSGLAPFWTAPEPPSPDLRAAFLALLADRVQVRGSFYDREGRRAAIEEIVRRIGQPQRYWRLDRPLEALGPHPDRRNGRAGTGPRLIAAE